MPVRWKKVARWAGGILSAVGLFSALDGFVLEPVFIEVTTHKVRMAVQRPIRIAHLTDLHTKGLGFRENHLVSLLQEQSPDLIVVTGDTVSGDGSHEEVLPLLRQLKAPLGVYATLGNWEYWNKRRQQSMMQVYQDAGVHLLINKSVDIGGNLWLVGFDDFLAGAPEHENALKPVNHEAAVIGLLHSPEDFDSLDDRIPLVLAGHTHGGQVRLPGLSPFWLPPGSGRFVQGWYERGGAKMYVSRGIGNSLIEVRFWCRPELVIIDILPKE